MLVTLNSFAAEDFLDPFFYTSLGLPKLTGIQGEAVMRGRVLGGSSVLGGYGEATQIAAGGNQEEDAIQDAARNQKD